MKYSDAELAAWLNGGLDLVARAEIEEAIAADPEVARAVERLRQDPAAATVAAAAGVPADEPARRRRARAPATTAPAAGPSAPRRLQLPELGAMAATLALGLFIGMFAVRGPEALYEETAAGLLARGALDWALSNQLAGDNRSGPVTIAMSFRDRDGTWCRTFRLQSRAPLAGLTCRTAIGWRLLLLSAAVPGTAVMPMAVLQAGDALIEGEPADAAAEAAARESGWRSSTR